MNTNIARFIVVSLITAIITRQLNKTIIFIIPVFIMSTFIFPTTKNWTTCTGNNGHSDDSNAEGDDSNAEDRASCTDYEVRCQAVFFCRATKNKYVKYPELYVD